MKIQLACSECEYRAIGNSEKQLMNRIIMWNHVKVAHPETSDRITERNVVLPDYFFHTLQA